MPKFLQADQNLWTSKQNPTLPPSLQGLLKASVAALGPLVVPVLSLETGPLSPHLVQSLLICVWEKPGPVVQATKCSRMRGPLTSLRLVPFG